MWQLLSRIPRNKLVDLKTSQAFVAPAALNMDLFTETEVDEGDREIPQSECAR